MPTTRPGFIWSGTEWVAIGQEAVVNPFYYQATAPTGAATGAIWIESDVDVPSIDSAQFLRWRKTMAGGETSLSGNDDSSLPLAYTPGYEQLYINGVLQVRNGDYTATTGTTVTGLTALAVNDVVEIFSAVARTVADVYTQTQSDARFVNKNVGGLNLVVPTSVTGGTLSANGQITFTSASTVTVNGCFTSTYSNYRMILEHSGNTTGNYNQLVLLNGATSIGASQHYWGGWNSAATLGNIQVTTGSYIPFGVTSGTHDNLAIIELSRPQDTKKKNFQVSQNRFNGTIQDCYYAMGIVNDTTSANGFRITFGGTSPSHTGTLRIYGYNNGA